MTSELRHAAAGWVPIETAPKDGTKAILYFPQDATDFDGVDYAYRLAIYRENAAFPLGAWCDQGTNHDSFEGPDMTGRDKASHWFPLPSAPTADREAVRAPLLAEIERLNEALCFIGKWVERGMFCNSVTASEAISCIAHYPGMPWNSQRWDVDHKPYAAAYYAKFPRTAALAGDSHDQ